MGSIVKHYDKIFITHLPAFYKVNLYNWINRENKIFVVFIAASSTQRTPDFTAIKPEFDYVILNKGDFENRSKLLSCTKLLWKLAQLKYKQVVVGGWDLVEFWMAISINTKAKNALALESSILESSYNGLAGKIKKLFLSRINRVYASGSPHLKLLQELSYKGECRKTCGVGIFALGHKAQDNKQFTKKFLYIGRLAKEKNLTFLIDAFRVLPNYKLTIVGNGPLRSLLQQHKPENVTVLSHVDNQEIARIYNAHDAFILPSLKEPWGLVVEEALYYGLPVIVSENVGCAEDLVLANNVGKLFSPYNIEALTGAIDWAVNNYSVLRDNVAKLDFSSRNKNQVVNYEDPNYS